MLPCFVYLLIICADDEPHSGILSAKLLTRFTDGDLSRLHSADDLAISWLQNVAVKALAK